MLIIKDIRLSKQYCSTDEKITLQVDIKEKMDYPFSYPHDYPIFTEDIALPKQ